MSNLEQTLSIIKPDAVERDLSDQIKNEFKKNGLNILKEKKVKLEKSDAEKFYFYFSVFNAIRTMNRIFIYRNSKLFS